MSERKPNVFVVRDTQTMNTYPAKRFGRLVTCVDGHVDAQDYDVAAHEVRQALTQATSGDYLLPIGSPALIALAAAEMSRRVETMRILQWDRITRQYAVIEIGSQKGR